MNAAVGHRYHEQYHPERACRPPDRLNAMQSSNDSRASHPWPRTTLRVLVVDDEALGRARVMALLARRKDVHIVGECANGLEAIGAVERHLPDLVFLDVVLPELGGLEVVEALDPERCPQVVFVTGHDAYQQQAFDLRAIGYLRKPFTDEKFYSVLDHACQRAWERLGYVEAHRGVLGLLADLRHESQEGQERVVVREKQDGIYHVLPTREIDWIKAKDRGILIHFEQRTYRSRHSLTKVEDLLDHGMFLRIHRSMIVNRTRIRRVEPLWKGEFKVTLTSGTSVVSGRAYRAAIEGFLRWA